MVDSNTKKNLMNVFMDVSKELPSQKFLLLGVEMLFIAIIDAELYVWVQ